MSLLAGLERHGALSGENFIHPFSSQRDGECYIHLVMPPLFWSILNISIALNYFCIYKVAPMYYIILYFAEEV